MTMRDVRGRRITVVGAARSGSAAAELLRQHGGVVFVTDAKPIEPSIASRLDDAGISYEEDGHTDRALDTDLFVVSPGVPTSARIVQKALEAAVPIYSEIEAASWFCKASMIAVTGSNGKTTTTSLIGHVFQTAGRTAHVGGNIGRPFSAFASAAQPEDIVVLEVSSFQLDHVDTFRPRVAVLLNVTPDHLDRYQQDFDTYARSKFRIAENQEDDDTFIFNQDDAVVAEYAGRLRSRPEAPGLMAFSQQSEVERGAFERDGTIVLRINEEEILMRSEELSLQGRHNLYNSLAAAVAARVMEVRSEAVRESLTSFEGVPHRLEFIRQVDGVRYVNDSKATNVNAVWYALESFDEPVVLIAGGRDKGNDYETLKPLVRQKARAVIAVGESADKVASELGSETMHSVTAGSFADAVRYARLFAEPGDVVLLSPACASFDMFQNYEERGDAFRKLVNEL